MNRPYTLSWMMNANCKWTVLMVSEASFIRIVCDVTSRWACAVRTSSTSATRLALWGDGFVVPVKWGVTIPTPGGVIEPSVRIPCTPPPPLMQPSCVTKDHKDQNICPLTPILSLQTIHQGLNIWHSALHRAHINRSLHGVIDCSHSA